MIGQTRSFEQCGLLMEYVDGAGHDLLGCLVAAILAAQAKSAKGDGIIVKPEARWVAFRKIWQLKTRYLQVGYFAALYATDMMVATSVGIEACFGLRATYFDHQANSDKRFQNTIDRCSRQAFDLPFQVLEELISGRMVFALNQGLEQCSSLVGQA